MYRERKRRRRKEERERELCLTGEEGDFIKKPTQSSPFTLLSDRVVVLVSFFFYL